MVCTVGIEALQAPACYKLRRRTPFRSSKDRCLTVQAVKLPSVDEPVSRRQALQGLAMLAASGAISQQALAAGKSAEVGSYLPAAGTAGFSDFKPDKSKTPALRSGVINGSDSYSFEVPSNYREVGVANIQSGNFCMPNCAEPWTEVVFADDKEGKIQLLVAPLQKLTPKANATIKDIGTIESLVQSFGTNLEDEDVLAKNVMDINGRTYYEYESYAPYGTNGSHQLSRATTKGKCAFLFVSSASDKQWPKGEKHLRQALESFRV
ncbi:MAG: psbP domain-containing chloroplastic-like [Trebouxia sp. A1-2]|nr:MAG: psbP domain-containing chloroplastic-like [Trebouxia sp. A1-2]